LAAGISTRLSGDRWSAGEGRRFGLLVGAAFVGLGGLLGRNGRSVGGAVAATIGGLLIVAGLAVPRRLGPVYRAWMALATLISRVTTPVFMGIVYFGLITPIGWVRRALGRNPLAPPSGAASFWVARAGRSGTRSDLERQF
jgi:hypothetical protein